MRFVLSQSRLKNVITVGIFSLVAIGILFNWAVPVSAQNTVPTKPDTPTLLALDKGMVEVDWNDVSGANRYQVQFYTSSGWIDLPNAGLGIEIVFDGSRAVATGLPDDMSYDAFRVRAGNSAGWSEWSDYAWQMTTHIMEWKGTPATGAPAISGTVRVGETLTADTSGIADDDGLTNVSYSYQWMRGRSDINIWGATGSSYTLVGADKGRTVKVEVRFADDKGNDETLTSAATKLVGPVQKVCPGGGYNPTPTDVEIDAVPIVVTSTAQDYFVLYVSHDVDDAELEWPVLVKRGEAGTTILAENVEALPAERYRVEKYLIADPADIDRDCIDDITELDDFGTNNPVNSAGTLDLNEGAVGVPDRATFEALARVLPSGSRFERETKFVVYDINTESPRLYFANAHENQVHGTFVGLLFDRGIELDKTGVTHGVLHYYPRVEAAYGSLGVYVAWDISTYPFTKVDRLYTLLAASMPMLEQDLVYSFQNYQLPAIQGQIPLYQDSRIHLMFEEDLRREQEADFIPLNADVGFGMLKVLEPDQRPGLRDVVIYEALPNNLPRVAGIISTVPQTPLSHVNLRAIQDGVPNAYIRNALDNDDIESLIGSYVRYAVTDSQYQIRAATRSEVDAHYDSSRPTQSQTPLRDLSVTQITSLNEIGFDDWDAFGVKAANVAVLGTLGFQEGTVPDGFAIPFYFYDEFMKHNGFYTRIETMLADADFQENFDTQDEELKDLRDAIEDGETPAWILTALADMNTGFPQGTINRKYRSSTNNEDLPGFNGAGLYDSKSQKPDEDEEDGLDKSLKEVYASLWTFRAFTERDFHRIDHLTAAMGILVHPSYQDELVNGVAVSFDPYGGGSGGNYYVNSQLGEDLVTNPGSHSVPEELLLYPDDTYTIVATSNQVAAGELLMSTAQINQLRGHLNVIHDHFAGLYNPAAGEPFAMEIEFKITSEIKLAIKQARPWVFSGAATAPPGKTLPSAPINLAVAPGDTSLTVVWDLPANTGGEIPTAYDVRYIKTSEDETDDANWTEQLRAWIESSGVMSYPITDLETGEQYDVQVRAENSVGKGAWSASETGTPMVSLEPPSTNTAGVSLSKTALTVMEEDTAGETYTVVLDSQPMTDVEVTVAGHAGTEVTPNPTTLTFTGSNWETVQTVTVTAGADADTMDGAVTLTHSAASTDSAYSGITIAGVTVTVNDNDTTNNPATGTPTISGDPQVGETLTADTSGIADADGLTNVSYEYQWIASDGNSEVEIANATAPTYTVAAEDAGRTIRVRVTFTDDAGTEQSLTSAATALVQLSMVHVWSATLTVGTEEGMVPAATGYSRFGFQNDGLSSDEFTFDGNSYRVNSLFHLSGGLYLSAKDALPSDFTLRIGDSEYVGGDSLVMPGHNLATYWWEDNGFNWTLGEEVDVNLSMGRALLPEREDAPPVAYFTRVPDGHSGSDSFTFALSFTQEVDVNKNLLRNNALLVEDGSVSEVNKRGSNNWEITVTPDSGDAVSIALYEAANCQELGAICTGSGIQLSNYPSFTVPGAGENNSPATGAPTITGTAQVGETLTADTSGIADDDGLANATYRYQWVANDGTTDTDIFDATDNTYTLVDDDAGRTIKVRVTVTDDLGNETTLTSAATDEVDFAVQQQTADSPATGAPTISGTAQVGETLTVDTSGIADDDGLVNATFGYRWVANDGTTDTDIAGATDAAYTLTGGDEGRTIKVWVSFSDDAGNGETLSSAATEAVAAADPPAKPTGLSAAAVSHEAVTLTWDDPQDDSITGYVILRRDRAIHPVGTFVTIAGDTGSADRTYTDATVEPEKEYVFRIQAINEHGGVSERSDYVRGFTPAAPAPGG